MSINPYVDQTTGASSLPATKDPGRPLFPLGQIVATPAVLHHFVTNGLDPELYVRQHHCGLWGEIPPEDACANDDSVRHDLRILSAYKIAGERVWIITEADRSSTTLLFPREY
jgi:hypothetical protein